MSSGSQQRDNSTLKVKQEAGEEEGREETMETAEEGEERVKVLWRRKYSCRFRAKIIF